MARAQVVVVTCDRCGGREEVPIDSEAQDAPEIEVSVGGKKVVSFDDLCTRCRKRTTALTSDIALDKKSKPQSSMSGGEGRDGGMDWSGSGGTGSEGQQKLLTEEDEEKAPPLA